MLVPDIKLVTYLKLSTNFKAVVASIAGFAVFVVVVVVVLGGGGGHFWWWWWW